MRASTNAYETKKRAKRYVFSHPKKSLITAEIIKANRWKKSFDST